MWWWSTRRAISSTTSLLVSPPQALRSQQVVVLDPSSEAPVGLNPLAGTTGPVAVDGLLGVMRSLWASSWGPRLNDVLHAGLLTLSLEPGHSLVELPLLLTNRGFRRSRVVRASESDPFGLGRDVRGAAG